MSELQHKHSFYDVLTSADKETVEILAKIEMEDSDRCQHCGGEDCICCEYYLDRQKWKEPEELFPYANQECPAIDSEEFRDYLEYNEIDTDEYDIDEEYRNFQNDWYRDLIASQRLY